MSLEDVARKHAEDLKNAALERDRKELESRQRAVWDEVCNWSSSLGGVTIEDYQFQGNDSATFTVEGRHFEVENHSGSEWNAWWLVYLLHGGRRYLADAGSLANALEAARTASKTPETRKRWGRRA